MAASTTSEYVRRAEAGIVQLLDEHLALVSPELSARMSENRDAERNIDPHHVTTALRNLTAAGVLTSTTVRTRGGRSVQTMHPADIGRRATALARASARKRLLMARWQGWTQGTVRHPHGLVGPAGEVAVRDALALSGALAPMVPGFAAVADPLGVRLGGSLDSGAFLVHTHKGVPTGDVIALLIEVKSVRSWIYPSSEELYQVLHKALLVQQEHPDQLVLPVLICRRAHPTLFSMARQVGFIAIETDIEFVGEVVDRELQELRNELYLQDLRTGTGPMLRVRDRFRSDALLAKIPVLARSWGQAVDDENFRELIIAARRAKNSLARDPHVANLRLWNTARGEAGRW